MIPKECKRRAEVGFLIAEVSRRGVREKSIRRGQPSTLHLRRARRPLASSRAVLMALLLREPCDECCPETFKNKARGLLPKFGCGKSVTDQELRHGDPADALVPALQERQARAFAASLGNTPGSAGFRPAEE